MRIRTWLIGILVLIMLSAIAAKFYFGVEHETGPNKATDGDFETAGGGGADIFANWTENIFGTGTIVDDTKVFHGGAHAARLTSGPLAGDYAALNRTIALDRSTKYRLSFRTRGDGAVSGNYRIETENSEFFIDYTYTYVTGVTWLKTTYEFTTGVAEDWVNISFISKHPFDVSEGAVWFDDLEIYELDALAWTENKDILTKPKPTWEYGLGGAGPSDIVALSGILTASLDNSQWNSGGLAGLYSPDHANALEGFKEGMKIKVTLPNHGDWEQEAKHETGDLTEYDGSTPAWDDEVDKVADFDAETDGDGDLDDSYIAAHDGAVGLEYTFDDNNAMYGTITLDAIDNVTGVLSFWFDRDDWALDDGKVIVFMLARDGAATNSWGLDIGRNDAGGGYFYQAYYYNDVPARQNHAVQYISSAEAHILLTWRASTGVGNDDGFYRIYENGINVIDWDGHDNDTQDWDYLRIGMNWTNSVGFGGSFYLDTIKADPVGAPFAHTLAAKNGSYGLAIPIMDTTARYVSFTDPTDETLITAECWVNPNAMEYDGNNAFHILVGEGSGANSPFSVQLQHTGSVYRLIWGARNDAGGFITVGDTEISDGWHHVRVIWNASRGPGQDTGYALFYLDGELEATELDIDNDTHDVDEIRFGACAGVDAGTYGILYLDDCRWSNELEQVKFIGTVSAIRPDSGLLEHPNVEIEALDWMGNLSKTELGVIPIAANKRADEALTTALANMPIQPEAVSFDTGKETFGLVFDTDHPQLSMAGFFQKMARNELGRIYLLGDGSLRFENRSARGDITIPDFELNGRMTDFEVFYMRNEVYNLIQALITPAEIDPVANVLIWERQAMGTPEIPPLGTIYMTCNFRDITTGQLISAIDVVNPFVTYEFGTVGDYVTDDMHADLSQNNTVGGNAIKLELTNDNAGVSGFINDLTIYGKGIYRYDPIIVEARDQVSIDERGERRYVIKLDQIIDENNAMNYATYLRNTYSKPSLHAAKVRFLANQNVDLMMAGIAAELSTRFTIIESVTGVSNDFFINRIKYTLDGPQLWVDVLAKVAWVYDSYMWD